MATKEQKEDCFRLVSVGTLSLESSGRNHEYRDIVVSADKIIIINSHANALNVRIHRLHDGKLLDTSSKLASEPRGVNLINDTTICVVLFNSQIEIMSVQCTGDTGAITPVSKLNVNTGFDLCHGVVIIQDRVVLCGKKQDTIFWCIASITDGHIDTVNQICEGSDSHLTKKDNTIYISCNAGEDSPEYSGVYGYEIQNPSKQTFIYQNEDLKFPCGVTVDAMGFIFVCNYDNPSCIHHLTDSGLLVKIYRDEIQSLPLAIFWDHHYEHLYVTNHWSNKIARYKPEYSDQGDHKQPVIDELATQKEHGTEKQEHVTEKRKMKREETSKSPGELVTPPKKQKTNKTGVEALKKKTNKARESQRPAGKDSDLDEEEFLETIRGNSDKIEEMIGNHKIPKQSTMKIAMKRYGYSRGVQMTLSQMSKLLMRENSQASDVWCGYRTDDPHTPLFVVVLKSQSCILKKEELLKPFISYEIVIRNKYVPNDEERKIVESYGNQSVRSEDIARVNNCIASQTERLMKEHSNLSIISPCHFKTSGYLKKNMKLTEETCIVFYVPVKGIIPVGEKEFPRDIDGIVTDVREGEFVFFEGHNAMEYHSKLRMGCCITGPKTGSLGGFVDLSGDKVGCLTAAHAVLRDDQIQQYINMGDEEKKKWNDDLAQGKELIEKHQPIPMQGYKPFGRVQSIALEAGNASSRSVDAAIIQITDDERKPIMGNFPDGDFENVGFTREYPMLYSSGDILDDMEPSQKGSMVIKFGGSTGITRGCLEWNGHSLRPLNVSGFSGFYFPEIFGQMEVKTRDFAANGDSGALVFLCVGGNIRNLQAVGMIIGGNSTGCSCYITPIKAIFEKLGSRHNRFRVFPHRQLAHQETTPQVLTERISALEHALSKQNSTLDKLSENVNTIENSMNQSLGRVEENMNESVKEHLSRVEQNVSENINKYLMRVEQNMTVNMNERYMMVEQNMSENMNERFMRVEQNMTENMNERFVRVEQNMTENMNERFLRTEQNMKEWLMKIEQNMTENMNVGFNRMENLFKHSSHKS
ncbi:hypothetical protein CHS0354_036455 [Potamilus streckersoni]|uniref:Uncharacterized protein n=1 Tax=Potamilus streckersoni TaxID=2493646 RepID=A0AAE0SWN7_9BIVA|nr:hypothetical protein CHS0354_036455 [Potamilus streckersoni]